MKWYCIKCKQDVDYEAFRCGCTESPSPWIPKVEVEFEKVEVKAGSRKLEGTWTVEFDEPIWDCSDEFREAMEMEIVEIPLKEDGTKGKTRIIGF